MLVKKTAEFEDWFKSEGAKSQAQIAARVKNIEEFNHFGLARNLGGSLAELKWKNGRRIYFTIFEENGKFVLLLLGGNKNGQDKDIKQAKKILAAYKE